MNKIKKMTAEWKESVIVFGDVNSFQSFLRRTQDEPKHLWDFMRELYEQFFEFSENMNSAINILGDGFISIHNLKTPREDPFHAKELATILKQLVLLQKKIGKFITDYPYPRPDGFRIRAAIGHSWDMTIFMAPPTGCETVDCGLRVQKNSIGYPTVLPERMLRVHRESPLVCCQQIKEIVSGHASIYFKELKPDRRIAEGIFSDDLRTLWAFGLKKN